MGKCLVIRLPGKVVGGSPIPPAENNHIDVKPREVQWVDVERPATYRVESNTSWEVT